MPIAQSKPTSPAKRFEIKVYDKSLHKGQPYAKLVAIKKKTGGRNNLGRITTRHIGGGHKQKYRIIDFKRDKDGIPSKVERIEYDPNRSAHIALLVYADGERRYIIAPRGLSAGDAVISGADAPIKAGSCLPLNSIPVGSVIHCVEMKPGKGAQIARSAGASVQLIAKDGLYATVRLRSGEMRKILSDCKAVIGEVSNHENNL
ncbi:50S ribosomal protein L2, partial [Gammaproteobacteria bacterium SCGC AG-212-F23]